MKRSNKAIISFLSIILMNIFIFQQTVLADAIAPPMSTQPQILIFFGVSLVVICSIVIYKIISIKKNK